MPFRASIYAGEMREPRALGPTYRQGSKRETIRAREKSVPLCECMAEGVSFEGCFMRKSLARRFNQLNKKLVLASAVTAAVMASAMPASAAITYPDPT